MTPANGESAIRIPGRLWLEHAKFVREGPDLVLVGQDGAKIVIADYFRTEPTPALLTENGGTFTPDLVAKLAGPLAPGQVAQAAAAGSVAQPIGRIETITGSVEITRADGTRVTVSKGDAVFSGDVVETGAKAAVSMILADDSFNSFVPSDSAGLVANWRLDDQTSGYPGTVDDVAGGHNGAISGNPVFVVNAAPVYLPDAGGSGDYAANIATFEDTAINGIIAAEDDSALTYSVSTAAGHGTVSITNDGGYIYTPYADFHGNDSFVVTITPTTGTAQTVRIAVTVAHDTSDDGQTLIGTSGADTLTGGANGDTIQGLGGNDVLDGGAGADILDGGAGLDTLTGGDGSDIFVSSVGGLHDWITDFSPSEDQLNLGASANQFTYLASSNSLVIASTGQGFTFSGSTGLDDVNFDLVNLYDNGLIKSLVSGSGVLMGGSNNDLLVIAGSASTVSAQGGAGSDRIRDLTSTGNSLDGGSGSDTLLGGAGSDTYFLGSLDGVQDSVVYMNTSDGGTNGDTIVQFETANDKIVFTNTGTSTIFDLLDRNHDGTFSGTSTTSQYRTFSSNASTTLDFTYKSIFLVNGSGGASAMPTVSTISSGTTDLNAAATAINSLKSSQTPLSNVVAGDVAIFVIENSAHTASGVYLYTASAAGSNLAVSGSELQLLATVDAVNLAPSNFAGSNNDQHITGTSGDDILYGGIDNDTFTVTAGSDVYHTGGNGGIDTLDFTSAYNIKGAELIGFDLVFTYTPEPNDIPYYTATIANHLVSGYELENIKFEFHDDIRTMDVATTFNGVGLTGDTAFAGTSTGDTITAGSGDDILLGNGGADTLNGGSGDDWLVGGQGSDIIIGGSDTDGDTVSFFSSPSGVVVDLSSGTAQDGWGTTDTISGVENVEGSDRDDTITGNSASNVIEGGVGADVLTGGGGNDRFVYRSQEDSGVTAGTRDFISDFDAGTSSSHNDQIDISALVQGTFSYIDTAAFSGNGNTEAHFTTNSGLALIEIDTNGDATADMQIQLDSSFATDHSALDSSDFKHS